jgi:hypothetical protein
MLGMTPLRWLHFSFDRHEVVRANGCLPESLYMGPMVLRNLPRNIQNRPNAACQNIDAAQISNN